jgi:hypothetical protein
MKRVPMDFDWPIGKVWGGYLNPYSHQAIDCPTCGGSGRSADANRFHDEWYGKVPFDPVAYGAKPLTVDHPEIKAFATRNVERSPDFYGSGDAAVLREQRRLFAHWRGQWCHHLIQADVDALVEAGRLKDFTHRPLTPEQAEALRATGNYWMAEPNGYRPTADEVNTWSLHGLAHDAINAHVCIEARCKRDGVPDTCTRCAGEGTLWPTPEIKQLEEDWKEVQPPTGEGFQLWETTSEGSPTSPVFATIEQLCEWCADNATTFASFKASAEEWRRMLDADFVVVKQGNMVFL